MYPECRHVLPNGSRCHAPAVNRLHWCYFHARLHHQQDRHRHDRNRNAARDAHGRFLPAPPHRPAHPLAHRPGSHAGPALAPAADPSRTPALALPPQPLGHTAGTPHGDTSTSLTLSDPGLGSPDLGNLDLGTTDQGYPVGAAPAHTPSLPEPPPLRLPPAEDNASVQLALIEVLQALAANQLDPRRAGLLLYGLQIAAQNARHFHPDRFGIRSHTWAANGTALSPPEQAYDIEDMDDEDDEEEEDDDE